MRFVFCLCFFLLQSFNIKAVSINSSKRRISNLKKSVKQFELSLKSTNIQFSKVIDMKNQLFEDISKTEQEINNADEKLKAEFKKFKTTLLRYEALEYSVEESDLKLVAVRRLKNKKNIIIENKMKLNELRKSLIGFQDKLSDYEFLEVDLIKKIESINEKVAKKRNELKVESKKYKRLKKRKVANKKKELLQKNKLKKEKKAVDKSLPAKVTLSLPVENPLKVDRDESGGLNFQLAHKQQINSPGDGTIIYSGTLSKYGNVIVVRHSDGFRSILLGKFLSNVKKGQNVVRGQNLAQALETAGEDNKLYFEFRKNKKKLIAENFLSKRI